MPPGPDVPTPSPTPVGGPAAGRPSLPPKRDKAPKKDAPRLKTRGYGFDKGEVRAIIARHFRIYEERDAIPGLDQAVLVAFFVLAPKEEVEAKYPAVQEELRALDPRLMPVLREEGGETIIVVTRRPEETRETVSRLPYVLLVATALTLTAAGSIAWISYEGSVDLVRALEPRYVALGFVGFAVPLLFMFGVQEAARRAVASRHGMRLGPSYLVPVPPFVFFPSIGTFGSVLNARDPWPSRRALFDVAAAGPIAGFGAALAVVVVGMVLTGAAAVPVPDGGAVSLEVVGPDGTVWSEGDWEGRLFSPFEREAPEEDFRAHNVTVSFALPVEGRADRVGAWNASARALGRAGDPVGADLRWRALAADGMVVASSSATGEVRPGEALSAGLMVPANASSVEAVLEYAVPAATTVDLGQPLAFRFAASFFSSDDDYVMHPVLLAGWTALLVLGVTLVPAGRLDGGAAARALLGDRMVWLSYAAIAALAVLSFVYPGWVYLVLFVILFLGARHPAPLNESTPLDGRRRLVALLLLLLLVVCFVPVPAELGARAF